MGRVDTQASSGSSVSCRFAGAARHSTVRTFFVSVLAWFCCATAFGQDNYREQMKGLDEQVQEIKSDVLGIAAELNRLEERLLYPSNTHLGLFVSLTGSDALRLDAVHVQIDGQPVARYIYSHQELEALRKGGVQRLYTGNIATGAHQLEVSIIGKVGGKDYAQSSHFTFNKGIEPKLVGITVAGPDTGKDAIEIGDW